jgi:hypothetical protein
MNEESLMKRTLVLTAKLVGAFTLWTLLLSFVVVAITSRAVVALSGGDTRKVESATPTPPPNPHVTRPNG